MLWILDASINISMEPTRAFIADVLPEKQLSRGYTMQSFFIGIGAVLAALMPWFLLNIVGMEKTSQDGSIPDYVKISFLVGGISFLAAMLWTIFTTKEYPPEFYDDNEKEESFGYLEGLKVAFKNMPKSFIQLAPVQFFTWLGLFLMWFYLTITICEHVFGAADPNSELYADGLAWANICFGYYSVVTFLFALVMPSIANKIGNIKLHFMCLLLGGLGLISIGFIDNQYSLLISMTGVGIAWASIVSIPYALIARDIPAKQMGIFMGLFNMFIVLPEIIAALCFGWVMNEILDNNTLHAVMLGGVLLIIAALLTIRISNRVNNN